MSRRAHSTLTIWLALLCAQAAAAPSAEPPTLAARALDYTLVCAPPDGWRSMDAATLDSARGGFELPSGLTMSLGIERLVSINGQLVAQSSFNIANVTSISGEEARQARDALGGMRLVQNGAGNFAPAGGPSAAGTFIQNSLSDQTIGAQTIISANVNSASLLKDLNFNLGLRDAGIRAVSSR